MKIIKHTPIIHETFDTSIVPWRSTLTEPQANTVYTVGSLECDSTNQKLKVHLAMFNNSLLQVSAVTGFALKEINVQPNSRYQLKIDVSNTIDTSLIAQAGFIVWGEDGLFTSEPLMQLEGLTGNFDGTHTLSFTTDAATNNIVLQVFMMLNDSTQNNLYFTINNVTLEEVNGGLLYTINQHSSLNKYRFGFNGKESDIEVRGQQDYGFRMYDYLIARFKSGDPLREKFPFYSPFHFAGNSPIANIDLEGAEPQLAIQKWSKQKGFINHGLYWKNQKCDGCDEWILNSVPDADGTFYYVARKQISIFGKEDFMWLYPSDPDAKWRSFNPIEYVEPKESFLNTAREMGNFGKVMEGVFVATIGTITGAEAGIVGSAFINATYEFVKQYSLSSGEMKDIDWANVAIEGAPLPKGMNALAGDIVKDIFQAGVDYTDGKFQFAGTKEKTFTEAGIEAISNIIATAVIGKYNEQIQGAFKNTDPKYTKPMIEQITKFATEYTKEIISNGMVDKYNEKQATPKN